MEDSEKTKNSGLTIPVDIKNTDLFKMIMSRIVDIFKDKRIDLEVINEHYSILFHSYTALNNNRCSNMAKTIEIAIANLTAFLDDKRMCKECKRETELLLEMFKSIRILHFEKDNASVTLSSLMNAQSSLDRYIYFKNKDKMKNRNVLEDTLLAMIVEISELANNTRCFKHWSSKGSDPREKLLSEYVDVMHFFLELGNLLGFTDEEINKGYIEKYMENITRQNTGY